MKGISQKLKEAAIKTGFVARQELLTFLDSKSAEFEAAENEAAILKILEEAIAQNLITLEEKNNLLNAIQEFQKKKISKVASDLIAASPNSIITLGGMLWLFSLYIGATWLVVGSLSSIQLREDLEKNNIKLFQVNELISARDELEKYKSQSLADVSKWKLEIHTSAVKNGIKPDPNIYLDHYKNICKEENKDSKDCQSLAEVTAHLSVYDNTKSAKEKEYESKKTISSVDNSIRKVDLMEFLPRIEFMYKFKFSEMLIMPVQVLTLILAIAMGILGSTITMTWTFLNQNNSLSPELNTVRTLRWFLLHPFVGALSALVMFVFAKAGQMTLLSDASDVTLNPFMLSLMGIAAGLFADRAYNQMSLVSSKFLGDIGVNKERWSINLEEVLKQKNITSEKLAATLNLDKDRIQEIVIGHRAASLIEQQRISDHLGIRQRLLFTDMPP